MGGLRIVIWEIVYLVLLRLACCSASTAMLEEQSAVVGGEYAGAHRIGECCAVSVVRGDKELEIATAVVVV